MRNLENPVEGFQYYEYDAETLLPPAWHEQIKTIIQEYARKTALDANSSIAREGTGNTPELTVFVIDGKTVMEKLPWLYDLYRDVFRGLAEKSFGEPVHAAQNPLHSVTIFVQRGSQSRFLSHVDSNPIAGLLYVTTHEEGSGGELVISNSEESSGEKIVGPDQIERDSTKILPRRGKLIFFDGRRNPHFVKPLKSDNEERIVIAMNYYTDNCPEEQRPSDVDKVYLRNS